jgi:hypothetical protein
MIEKWLRKLAKKKMRTLHAAIFNTQAQSLTQEPNGVTFVGWFVRVAGGFSLWDCFSCRR